MAVSQAVFDSVKDQLGDWSTSGTTPVQPQKRGSESQIGMNALDSVVESGKELASSFGVGFSRGSDFIKAFGAGVLMPLIPEGDTPAAKAVWSALRPSMDTLSDATKQRAEKPKTVVGRVFGPMAEGVGGMATMPIPGGSVAQFVTRNVLSGAGMGEGADIGKNVLGGVAERIDPEYKPVGETIGAMLGGGLGGQINVTRAKLMADVASRVLKAPIDIATKAKPVYDAAKAKQMAGDKRNIWSIMGDEFGNLRASTKGIISQYTNRELANAIGRDMDAMAQAEKFPKDVAASGVKLEVEMPEGMVKPWGLPQRTLDPTMVALATKEQPRTLKEGVQTNVLAKARQKTIADAFDKVVGYVVGSRAAEAAGRLFGKVTNAKVKALSTEEEQIRQTFPDVNSKMEAEMGDQARARRDELNQQSLATAAQKYDQANALWKAPISVSGLRGEAKSILNEFISLAAPEDVPPVVRNILSATAPKAPAAPAILPASVGMTGPLPVVQAEPATLNLQEANDLSRFLTKVITRSKQADNRIMAGRAMDMKQELQSAIEASPASPEAKAAYDEAKRYWAEEHAPRFREAYGRAVGAERGGIWTGREAVESQKVLDKAMESETSMREWDTLFRTDPKAKALLSQALEGKFRHDVLRTPKTPAQFEIMLDEFTNKNSHVLERLPDVAAKIEKQSADTLALMREKEGELDRYKRLMNLPITQRIGPHEANHFYGRLLADPQKTEEFLSHFQNIKQSLAKKMAEEIFLRANPMRGNEYNGEALIDILGAGSPTKSDPLKASSMEKIFNAAFGKEKGQHHMQTLEAIAEMAIRERATNPELMKAGSLLSGEPIKEATGQSAASHLSNFRSMVMHQASGRYFAILGISRFANAKAQAAIRKAQQDALYDPDTADAILEMSKTPTPSRSILMKVFGNLTDVDGKKLVDKFMDTRYVDERIGRGVAYGAEKSLDDQKRGLEINVLTGKREPGAVYFEDIK